MRDVESVLDRARREERAPRRRHRREAPRAVVGDDGGVRVDVRQARAARRRPARVEHADGAVHVPATRHAQPAPAAPRGMPGESRGAPMFFLIFSLTFGRFLAYFERPVLGGGEAEFYKYY